MFNNIFYHGGSFGDIIYSIPFCLSVVGITHQQDLSKNKFKLILDMRNNHKIPNIDAAYKNLKKIQQLMLIQPYIQNVICDKNVDWKKYNALCLGDFRNGLVNMKCGDICLRYNFLRSCLKYYNLYEPWIVVPQTDKFDCFKDKIIVFRTNRYRSPRIHFEVLKEYQNHIVYIGFEEQYNRFCRQNNFKPQFLILNNFIQICQLMKKCAFVVGNQTFFFSLAQALKIPRILEYCYNQPDVITHGDFSNYIVNDNNFKVLLKMYYEYFIANKKQEIKNEASI